MTIEPVFVGANPGCVLTAGERTVARVSVWDAHWSINGPGRVGIVAIDGGVTVVSRQRDLARWLANDLTAYFPEFDGVDLAAADYVDADLLIDALTPTELVARFAGFEARIGASLELRPVTVERWQLGPRTMRLTNLLSPSSTASLSRNGTPIAGEPSVAFVATSERWDVVS